MAKTKSHRLSRIPVNGVISIAKRIELEKGADRYIANCMKRGKRSHTSEAKKLEQYYTCPEFVSVMCLFVAMHIIFADYLIIEPSAGSGAISGRLPKGSISLDVAPNGKGIIKADFLSIDVDYDHDIAVIGNPPFSVAIEFFNHAANFSAVIAMILPRSFKKASIIRRLNKFFHLEAEMDVPRHAFRFEGKPYDVPAVLQVWKRKEVKRLDPPYYTSHAEFTFGRSEGANFVIQRVGANAGMIHHSFQLSDQSHLFVTVTNPKRAKLVEENIRKLPLSEMARNSAVNPCIAKSDIYSLYHERFGSTWCYRRLTNSFKESYCPHGRTLPAQSAVCRRVKSVCSVSNSNPSFWRECRWA